MQNVTPHMPAFLVLGLLSLAESGCSPNPVSSDSHDFMNTVIYDGQKKHEVSDPDEDFFYE